MFGQKADQGLIWGQPTQPSLMMRSQPQQQSNPSSLGQQMNNMLPSMPVGDKGQLCKYFVNGGCLRGDSCQFLHELPDERHLDVNGLGFIFNSNVHNAGKSQVAPPNSTAGLHRKLTPPVKKQIPRYRPPEPHMEHNLPPALATAFNAAPADIMTTLMRTLIDSSSVRLRQLDKRRRIGVWGDREVIEDNELALFDIRRGFFIFKIE